jgi:4'-phosphopantetheinyl transferase
MDQSWTTPGAMPQLEPDHVQVWRLDLRDKGEGESDKAVLLDRAAVDLQDRERERASRMRTLAAREEFIAGRAGLRRLLGQAMQRSPREIDFDYGLHGKPQVRSLIGIDPVPPSFNVSHSCGMVLIALSRCGPVGVDIEYVDASVSAIELARASFQPVDRAHVEGAVDRAEQLDRFYRCWTRQEAVLKADGRGLTLQMAGIPARCGEAAEGGEHTVELQPDQPAGRSQYFASGIEVDPDFRAAIATAQPGLRKMLFNLNH